MADKNVQLAKDILEAVGGKDNIQKATHCATRLRLILKDESKANKEAVENMDGVVTVVLSAGQFQIVIGQHVRLVYDAIQDLLGESSSENEEESEGEKGTVLNRVIATMSAVFAPFIYILAAAGILQGSLIIINLIFPQFSQTGTYEILSMISWAPFVFLPIFIAVTASKHFGSSPYIAIAANAALVSPSLAEIAARISEGETFSLFGFPLSPTTYTSTVLPAIFLVWGLSYLEKNLDKILPEVIRPLFTPFFSLLISVPLTLLVIGPATAAGANMVANGYNTLADSMPMLAGIIIGGFWQVFVLFGVHWGITPVVLANFAQYGMDSFQAYQTIAVIGQVGAAVAVALKTKDKKIKRVGYSATLTGLFGITEPAIYGITLRFKKPFIVGCISGAIASLVASFMKPYYFAYAGLPGPLTVVNAYSPNHPSAIWGEVIGALIAFILPIIIIQLTGYGEDSTEEVETEKTEETVNQAKLETPQVLARPMVGEVIDLSEVPDPVFSSGAMGQGGAIIPSEGLVRSPINGTVEFVADSLHAVGLKSDSGVEVLIHVGLDTVDLQGGPFSSLVEVGQHVKVHEPILEADLDAIKEAGLETITPVIITNTADYSDITLDKSSETAMIIIK